MENPLKPIDPDPLDKICKWWKRTAATRKSNPVLVPTWMQGIGSWLQAAVAVLMVSALFQNSKALKTSAEALRIEQETRLNPELECAYDWMQQRFVFRNVGDVTAEVTYQHSSVYFIQTNEVLELFHAARAQITPRLQKNFSPREKWLIQLAIPRQMLPTLQRHGEILEGTF